MDAEDLPGEYWDLTDEADNAYIRGQIQQAALLYEKARSIAEQYEVAEKVFYCASWAADCWELSGHPMRALAILTDILSNVPPTAHTADVFSAKRRVFMIFHNYQPKLAKLQVRLADLASMAEENSALLTKSDIHRSAACLLVAQGCLEEALQELERAWATWSDKKEGFSVRFYIAYVAALNCLMMAELSVAARWCKTLKKTEKDRQDSRVAWHIACAHLALFERSYSKAITQASLANTSAEDNDDRELVHAATIVYIRSLLLQKKLGDPANQDHPARNYLSRRMNIKRDVYDVYERRLLLVDYRLAALRYSLGMKPIDDYWYTRRQILPNLKKLKSIDRSDIPKRVFHTRRAIQRAMYQAKYLDDCFECDWRQKEILGREERLEEMTRLL